ncbi:MAG: hydantoinase/oxoprolinase family protein [Alphaproteobacteria bacterium]|jgi:N-methylhydantoinase A|nr:hydantoinase/oxoprolinase family protein [Alphaproteobacteria bacterium]
MVLVGVDTGGTFTDVAASDPESGALRICKVASTPADPSEAFAEGIRTTRRQLDGGDDDIALVVHGTTVATNAMLQAKGARAALITTEGFRYVLDLGRHDVPRGVNLFQWRKPERPITPDLIFEVQERLDHRGEVLAPLDEETVTAAVDAVERAQVDAVAVCLLHSYANPSHEQRIAEILAARLPDLLVCLSSEVFPAFREYERTLMVALNATVMPLMSGYIGRVRQRLREMEITAPFLVMKSNGGVGGARNIARAPVYTAYSGLAAGVVGACVVGRASGYEDLISLDVGGTSADVAICPGAEPIMAPETLLGDLPLKAPSVDVRTIGAGGGSIAAVQADGSLAVGPESAGAEPGPACYGRGGRQATVTDAQLVLGRLPAELAGGRLTLDEGLARRAIEETIARQLSLSLEEAAYGALEIVTHNIAGAVRAVSIERGEDPRGYALVAFGGAGPVHAPRLAELLQIRHIVLPRFPGVLSALGLLATPLRSDYVRTCLQQGPDYDLAAIDDAFELLAREAVAWFEDENIGPELRQLRPFVDVRYPQQGHELQVAVANPGRAMDGATMAALETAFHDQHEQLYGYALRDSPPHLVNVRLVAVGRTPPLRLPEFVAAAGAPRPVAERRVYWDNETGYVTSPVFRRADLAAGAEIAGPALLDQDDSTVTVPPSWHGRVDGTGNLILEQEG